MLDAILLTKMAIDAGFDLERGVDHGWLHFGVAGRRLQAWLRSKAGAIEVALSRADVLQELGCIVTTATALPAIAAGCLVASSSDDVIALLSRARLLDRTLPTALLDQYHAAIAKVDSTEAMALVKQRRGQQIFRQGLFEYWQGRCAISGLAVPALLRASHAKPWKDATDAERLDVHNGLLLAAHLDAAFDEGLIGVNVDGTIAVSESFDVSARAVLGLGEPRRIDGLKPAHAPYLVWHRDHIFQT